ncbi:MAG: TolC family protein [Calditrichaeota bacterium]|nr:MAG: TolC family protein [Calditrichota bacterium]
MIKIIIICAATVNFSTGQTLADYSKIAAENNPGLQAAYKEYKAALQKVPQVSALPDPTLSFGYFLSEAETRVGPQKARFSLTQMFPWFGTLKTQGDAAALQAEAKFQVFIDQRNKLNYQVAAAYYPLYEISRFQEIEQENIKLLESYKTVAVQNFQNGAGRMVDVLQVDMMLKEAQTGLRILSEKEKSLRADFNQLLNRPADHPVQITDTLSVDLSIPDASITDSLLAQNPVIWAWELKYRSAIAGEKAAFRQGLPKIGFGLDYVVVDKRTDMDVTDNGKDILMPMLSVSIPLFRGKYKAAQEESRLMQQSYLLGKDDAVNKLIKNYEVVRFGIRRNHELIDLYDQQTETARQTLNLLFTSYANSGSAFEEVLRMEQQLLNYRKMKVAALSGYHIALEKLKYLTAGQR